MIRQLSILAVLALSLTGCMQKFTGTKEGMTATAGVEKPPTVSADEVNDNNARAMAVALEQEIWFDSRAEGKLLVGH